MNYDIIIEILKAMKSISMIFCFQQIKQKYQLSEKEFCEYIDYCRVNNFCDEYIVETKLIDNAYKHRVGYYVTKEGQYILDSN